MLKGNNIEGPAVVARAPGYRPLPGDSGEHLSTILDSVADGVFTVDKHMRITSYNRAAEEITGFSHGEAIGRHCYDILRAGVCFSACPVKEALETGRSVANREVDILSKDGLKVPISVSASVLRDRDGVPIGGVETFRDRSLICALKREIEEKYTFRELVSRNPAMRRIFDVMPDIASSGETVLLRGESGTGKEIFAKAIHDLSRRKDGPLALVGCGALPESLLESEIFGVRRGAFTGATEDRPGRLEMADGGTLFLDEIGDLSLPLQLKLLRLLESREYQSLGAPGPKTADVRILAATNRDLEAMVEAGSFNRDLFLRINVVAFQIPPLRQRREDIPLLIDTFLDRFNRTYGKKIRGFSAEALQVLLNHDYPGNIRELLNILEQTVILCRTGEIGMEHLPAGFIAVKKPEGTLVRHKKTRITQEALQEFLQRHGGNRTRVAEELGVDRTTLWRWMKRFGLSA